MRRTINLSLRLQQQIFSAFFRLHNSNALAMKHHMEKWLRTYRFSAKRLMVNKWFTSGGSQLRFQGRLTARKCHLLTGWFDGCFGNWWWKMCAKRGWNWEKLQAAETEKILCTRNSHRTHLLTYDKKSISENPLLWFFFLKFFFSWLFSCLYRFFPWQIVTLKHFVTFRFYRLTNTELLHALNFSVWFTLVGQVSGKFSQCWEDFHKFLNFQHPKMLSCLFTCSYSDQLLLIELHFS